MKCIIYLYSDYVMKTVHDISKKTWNTYLKFSKNSLQLHKYSCYSYINMQKDCAIATCSLQRQIISRILFHRMIPNIIIYFFIFCCPHNCPPFEPDFYKYKVKHIRYNHKIPEKSETYIFKYQTKYLGLNCYVVYVQMK